MVCNWGGLNSWQNIFGFISILMFFFLVRLLKVKLHVFKYLEKKINIWKHLKIWEKGKVSVTQSCLTFCEPMGYYLPGCSVHGISQARILEWVTIPLSRESSGPRDQNGSSSLQAGSLPSETKYCYILERMQYCFFLGLGIN